MKRHFAWIATLCLTSLFLAPLTCQAVPSFARQTGLQCIACHTEFPELNSTGRLFKLSGFTLAPVPSDLPPFAIMLQPSFTLTRQDQPSGTVTPGFKPNSNFALTQASLFYAGRLFGPYASDLFGKDGAAIANKFGIFSQTTYDGVADRLHWDNTELRYADNHDLGDTPMIYGAYLNNNPTLQDPWNTTPAWSFPFSQTGLPRNNANTGEANVPPSPLIDGPLAQTVAGAGAYVFLDNSYYFDVAAYHMVSAELQNSLGIDPDNETQIAGFAPYWRLAYTKAVDNNSFEIGTFGLAADTYPGRNQSAGTDGTFDVGFDGQAQFAFGHHDLTAMLSWIHERDNWAASSNPLVGAATNSYDSLQKFKATVDYLYDKTYGAAVQFFDVDGSDDPALYANSATGSPGSDGEVLQLNWLPFNKGTGPSFWPRSNVKFSLSYTIYNRINGASHGAAQNNTLYLEAWIAF